MIEPNDAWTRIFAVGGEIFSVSFMRKNPKYDENKAIVEPRGAIRRMVCRRRVRRYTRGVIAPAVRMAEDVKHNVLTVFDLQFFMQHRQELLERGFTREIANLAAGRAAYRRINMAQVVDISIPSTVAS
jgi:hypothetical protein